VEEDQEGGGDDDDDHQNSVEKQDEDEDKPQAGTTGKGVLNWGPTAHNKALQYEKVMSFAVLRPAVWGEK
jgi:hypothetical protein